MSTQARISVSRDFRVADLSLAPFGRKEMLLAEHEICLLYTSDAADE